MHARNASVHFLFDPCLYRLFLSVCITSNEAVSAWCKDSTTFLTSMCVFRK